MELIPPSEMPKHVYHMDSAFGSTTMKTAAQSGVEYMKLYEPVGKWKILRPDTEDKDYFLFGDMVHDRALLGHKRWRGEDRSKRGKEEDGVLPVARRLKSQGSLCQRDLVGCTLSVREALRHIRSQHSSGEWFHEHSAFAEIEVSDGSDVFRFDCKARPDILLVDGKKALLFDLKTSSQSVDAWKWKYTVDDRQYNFSLAWYEMVLEEIGIEVVDRYWIAVSTQHPWNWEIHQADAGEIASARIDCLRALVNVGRGRKYGWFNTAEEAPVGYVRQEY